MIFRLTEKLAKRFKAGTLSTLPVDENPYADWSAHLFTADRTQYILVTNTRSLYSVVTVARDINDDCAFIARALEDLREFMDHDGLMFLYQRFMVPASHEVRFAKSLNRSVTGSMNDLIAQAKFLLADGELSPYGVNRRLNETPMSAIRGGKSGTYGIPRDAFKLLADALGSGGEKDLAAPEGAGEPSQDGESSRHEPEVSTAKSSAANVGVNLTSAQRIVIGEIRPELAERLKLDEKHARTISFARDELEAIRRQAEEAILYADNRMKRNSLGHVIEAASKAIDKSRGIGAISASERLYQFKITLLEFEPAIWRRIQVKDGTLDKLHEHIQTAMGWTNSHLHQFRIDGVVHGDPELLYEGWMDERLPVDSRITRISEIVPQDGKRFGFRYEYDFGDDWQHEVLFEGCLRATAGARYPLCVEGERACPPEDVGGVWGYGEFLLALADPDHDDHDDFVQWGGPFDPEVFDAEKATKAMRRGLPDWRDYR